MPIYSREPCFDTHGGEVHSEHYHEIGGDDWIVKVPLESVPRNNLAPNVLGMKALVYGLCAAIVLLCLVYLVWSLWP